MQVTLFPSHIYQSPDYCHWRARRSEKRLKLGSCTRTRTARAEHLSCEVMSYQLQARCLAGPNRNYATRDAGVARFYRVGCPSGYTVGFGRGMGTSRPLDLGISVEMYPDQASRMEEEHPVQDEQWSRLATLQDRCPSFLREVLRNSLACCKLHGLRLKPDPCDLGSASESPL